MKLGLCMHPEKWSDAHLAMAQDWPKSGEPSPVQATLCVKRTRGPADCSTGELWYNTDMGNLKRIVEVGDG